MPDDVSWMTDGSLEGLEYVAGAKGVTTTFPHPNAHGIAVSFTKHVIHRVARHGHDFHESNTVVRLEAPIGSWPGRRFRPTGIAKPLFVVGAQHLGVGDVEIGDHLGDDFAGGLHPELHVANVGEFDHRDQTARVFGHGAEHLGQVRDERSDRRSHSLVISAHSHRTHESKLDSPCDTQIRLRRDRTDHDDHTERHHDARADRSKHYQSLR